MKRVVLVLAKDEVPVQEVTNASFVGIMFADEDEKSWVASTTRGYQGMSLGEQDMLFHWSTKTKREYVETVLDMGAKVFLFETYEELSKWLKS